MINVDAHTFIKQDISITRRHVGEYIIYMHLHWNTNNTCNRKIAVDSSNKFIFIITCKKIIQFLSNEQTWFITGYLLHSCGCSSYLRCCDCVLHVIFRHPISHPPGNKSPSQRWGLYWWSGEEEKVGSKKNDHDIW